MLMPSHVIYIFWYIYIYWYCHENKYFLQNVGAVGYIFPAFFTIGRFWSIQANCEKISNNKQRCSWLNKEMSRYFMIKLMKKKRVLETTLETKIVNQCNLEGQKMKILQSLQYPVTVNITPLKSVQRVTTHNISQSCPPQSKRCIADIKKENVNKVENHCLYPVPLSYIQWIVTLMMSNC